MFTNNTTPPVKISQSRLTIILSLMCCLLFSAGASGEGLDLHWLWDDRCAECHGHSAEFARRFLQDSDGQLQGQRLGEDLALFLRAHYTPAAEVDAVYAMLLAQVNTPAAYQDACSGCHGIAAEFIRSSIILEEGKLFGRENGRSVAEFMNSHRSLDQEGKVFFINLLTRVANEIYRP